MWSTGQCGQLVNVVNRQCGQLVNVADGQCGQLVNVIIKNVSS